MASLADRDGVAGPPKTDSRYRAERGPIYFLFHSRKCELTRMHLTLVARMTWSDLGRTHSVLEKDSFTQKFQNGPAGVQDSAGRKHEPFRSAFLRAAAWNRRPRPVAPQRSNEQHQGRGTASVLATSYGTGNSTHEIGLFNDGAPS